jgi:hypothetical protein
MIKNGRRQPCDASRATPAVRRLPKNLGIMIDAVRTAHA